MRATPLIVITFRIRLGTNLVDTSVTTGKLYQESSQINQAGIDTPSPAI